MTLNFSPCPEFVIAAERHFSPGEEHVTRLYSRSVLILMIEGELSFLEDGKQITLSKGEYYIQRHGLLQEGLPLSKPPSYIYIEFHGSYSDSPGLPLQGRFDPDRALPSAIRLCNSCRSDNNPFYLAAYMNRVFGELIPRKAAENSTACLIKNYIESDYSTDITLSSLSEKFNYTEDYISRIFRQSFDTTPHQHLTAIRLEQAMWLLDNTDHPCEKIASMVGYSNFSTFYRAFRGRFSLSPSSIRRQKEPYENPRCLFYKPITHKGN